jgi:hypothetical protein
MQLIDMKYEELKKHQLKWHLFMNQLWIKCWDKASEQVSLQIRDHVWNKVCDKILNHSAINSSLYQGG